MLPQVFLPAIYCSWYEKWSFYTPYLCFNVWRTNNATESFHAHYNAQFNGDHPNIYIFFMLFKNNNLYHMLNCYQQILLHLNAKLIKKELNTKRLNMINFYVKKLICSHIWNHWVILSMLYWKSININCKFILCLFIYTYFISF